MAVLQVCKRAARKAVALHPEAGKEALKREVADSIDKSLCVLFPLVGHHICLQIYKTAGAKVLSTAACLAFWLSRAIESSSVLIDPAQQYHKATSSRQEKVSSLVETYSR